MFMFKQDLWLLDLMVWQLLFLLATLLSESFAAFLLGTLQTGAPGMTTATIPPELVNIVTASIIFFVSAHYIIEKYIKPKKRMKGVE